MSAVRAVVFDLGGVLIDWNPRHLYRRVFTGDEPAMERFLAEVCTQDWNERLDAGLPFGQGIAELTRRYPEERERIAAWRDRWEEMLAGPIAGAPELLREVKQAGVPVFALSNFSAETFPIAERRFGFLSWFDGLVISGRVGVCKPDAAIFCHLLERFGLDAPSTVFVDDSERNVAAARRLGFQALRFRSAARLRRQLAALGVIARPGR